MKISRIGRSAVIQMLPQGLYLLHNLASIYPFALQFAKVRLNLLKLLQDELPPAVPHTHLLALVVLVVVDCCQARASAGVVNAETATVSLR